MAETTDITAHNIQSPSESGVVTPWNYWVDSPESVAFKQPWVPQLGDNLQTCLEKALLSPFSLFIDNKGWLREAPVSKQRCFPM